MMPGGHICGTKSKVSAPGPVDPWEGTIGALIITYTISGVLQYDYIVEHSSKPF